MHLNVNSVLDNPVASMMVLCEQLGVPMGRWVGQGCQLTFSPSTIGWWFQAISRKVSAIHYSYYFWVREALPKKEVGQI